MEKLSRRAVIFDMDGVIFDSEKAFIDSYEAICREDGIEFSRDLCIDCIGVNRSASKQLFLDHYGADFDYDSYYERVRERMRNTRFDMKPCVFEILAYLKDRGVSIALASSTSTSSVTRMLGDAGLTDYFDELVCGDMVTHSKPHPEIFLYTASRLGIDPLDCYVIEDSFNGIRCAHNAGMHPIMVPDILQPDEDILGVVEKVFPSLKEVKEYFEEIL